jgi:hypothetical protein
VAGKPLFKNVITANHPKTAKLPKAKRIPKIFLLFIERIKPNAARIATNRKIMTVPI